MKAMVTGATGYIGSKLCEQLLQQGWSVAAITRATGRKLSTELQAKAKNLHHDGSTDSLLRALENHEPDVVFHLASVFAAEHRTEQVTDLINSNLLFGAQLAEACVRTGVPSFINTGTCWQHYRSNTYDPVCLYAATKQAFEDILDFYANAFPLRIATLKLSDTYGPDDPRPKLVNLLIRATQSGEHLGLSPGQQLVDLVHVNDVTRAFVQVAELLKLGSSGGGHRRYAVSSGRLISICDLAALIARSSDKQPDFEFGARPYRAREVMTPHCPDPPPPGWQPRIGLTDGIAECLRGL